MDKAYTMVQHTMERLETIFQTFHGWVIGAGLLLLNYIAGNEMAVGLVVGITLMDAAVWNRNRGRLNIYNYDLESNLDSPWWLRFSNK